MWSFGINYAKLGEVTYTTIAKLHLYANMEGFRRACHNYNIFGLPVSMADAKTLETSV